MSLERRLQINLAIMTSLGTLLLAVAEGDARLGVLGVAASASSVYFCDVKRWIVLNSLWSNVVGVVALALTLVHWQALEREMLFIALANFLTYLQCILHFRAKVQHVYGMLMLLSFLQMAVGSVLASTVTFAVLLLAYLWFAVRTLSLFSILREQEDAVHGPSPAAREPTALSIAELFVTPIHRLAWLAWQGLTGGADPPAMEPRPSRWPLAGRPSRLAARLRPGDDAPALRGLAGHVLKFGLLTLLLAPLVFVIIPRPGQQQGGMSGGPGATALTGFSERVMLRDVTRIRENPDEVMRITATDYKNGQPGRPYELREQPWLRGKVLGRYAAAGSWKDEDWGDDLPAIDLDRVEPANRDVLPDPGENDLVLFEVTLERQPSTIVFTLDPAYRVPGAEPCHLRKGPATGNHRRSGNRLNSTFTYRMLTTGLKGGRQVRFRPEDRPYDWRQKVELLEPFASVHEPDRKVRYAPRDLRPRVLADQRRQLKGLEEVAKEVLRNAGLDPRRNPREAAQALERYLHHEGQYRYSLNPPPRRPASGSAVDFDPVNDFVVDGRVGHCEYFASALALMLRSQGIPSRLVVGYKGGEWNALAGYYEVRQMEAHAWVEAWIFQDDLPLGWLRLDPTPAEGVPVIQESPRWKQTANYLHYLWSRYVLGMDANLQEELVQPLAVLFQRETWEAVLQWMVSALVGDGWSQESFNWRACLLVIGGQLLLLASYKLARRLRARLGAWRRRAALRRRGIPLVEFYVRLEQLLERCGLSRRAAQTPWEFAADSAGELAGSPATVAAAPLLSPIVQAYYRVRFGGPPLTDAERESLAEELTRLEAIVTQAAGDGPNNRTK